MKNAVVDIRSLQKRVIFQSPTQGVDADGFPVSGYTDYATCWAQVVGGSATRLYGKEFVGAEAVQSENQLMVTIRYREDITADMRMVYQGKPYVIVALADKDGSQVWMDIMVRGWTSGGI